MSAKQDVKIAGVSRAIVVVGLSLLTGGLVYVTGAILTLAWGTLLGAPPPLLEAGRRIAGCRVPGYEGLGGTADTGWAHRTTGESEPKTSRHPRISSRK